MKKLLVVFLCIISVFYTYKKDLLPVWTSAALDSGTELTYELLDQARMKKSQKQAEVCNSVSAESGRKYVPCQYYKTYGLPRAKDVELPEPQYSTGLYYVSSTAPSGLVMSYTYVSDTGPGVYLRYNGAAAGTSGYALYRTTNRGDQWDDYGYITFTGQIEELKAVEGTVVLNTCSYLEGYPHTMLMITANSGKGWSSYELTHVFPQFWDIEGLRAEILELDAEQMTLGLFVQEGTEQEAEPYYFYTAEAAISVDMLEITAVLQEDWAYLQEIRARQKEL